MLVKAFAQLGNPSAQLAIVGPDDGQRAEVQNLIQQFGLSDRAVITGLVSDSDKVAAFQDADLFVLPSRYDAFPTTIMEACLAGTPMVITDRCASASLVQDRVADVVPFDADAFAAAMERLLTDHERHERYRRNSQSVIADTFSIEAVVDRLETVYERVVAEKQKGRHPGG
jgi:glycosyltransferase involved in cell wall biosynthesis